LNAAVTVANVQKIFASHVGDLSLNQKISWKMTINLNHVPVGPNLDWPFLLIKAMVKNKITVKFSEYQVEYYEESKSFADGSHIGNLFVIRLEYNDFLRSWFTATDD
jgi:hypothetical protein